MGPRDRSSSSPSVSRVPAYREAGARRDRGYALLILMMLATILLISLAAALPSIYHEGQREREEELIFRGNEYARAILFFNRQFHRYPASVEELLKRTNGLRFLRHAYPDPMSRTGKWRFIHLNANGVLLDSHVQKLQVPVTEKPESPATGTATAPETGEKSAFFGENPTRGGFIVGVASTSRRESIRVWNNRTHYDEWEFLGVLINQGGVPPAQPAQPAMPGAPQSPMSPTVTGQPEPKQ